MDKIQALPTAKNPPQGIQVVDIGDAEAMGELFANFAIAMSTGVFEEDQLVAVWGPI